jgi:hypothetical protein
MITSRPTRQRGVRVKKPEELGELSLFFRCHGAVLAIAARWVERLLLAEEVALPEGQSRVQGAGQVIEVAGAPYAAWDLGQMLEVSPMQHAWVLMKVPYAGKEVPMALRTGPCLIVQPLAGSTNLPIGVFRGRRSALAGAFMLKGLKGAAGEGLVGLRLDPSRLWTNVELEASSAALAAAQARGHKA